MRYDEPVPYELLLLQPLVFGPPLAAPLPASPPASAKLTCPADMKLVVGTHHEQVQRYCLRFEQSQCWDYHGGLVALESTATPVAACMDRFEWPNREGALPPVMMRFGEAQDECKAIGKRLCTEFEWELACEGPETRPFPYGWKHEAAACTNDKPYKPYSQRALSSADPDVREKETKRLYQAEPSGTRPRCESAFGVRDLVGNVEEWVTTSRPQWPYESSLKGGYWSKPWSGCRGTNDSHGPMFRFYEIGFRCCADPITATKP